MSKEAELRRLFGFAIEGGARVGEGAWEYVGSIWLGGVRLSSRVTLEVRDDEAAEARLVEHSLCTLRVLSSALSGLGVAELLAM